MVGFVRFFEIVIAAIGILNMIALVSVEILFHLKRISISTDTKVAGTCITTLIACLITEFAIDIIKLFIV